MQRCIYEQVKYFTCKSEQQIAMYFISAIMAHKIKFCTIMAYVDIHFIGMKLMHDFIFTFVFLLSKFLN